MPKPMRMDQQLDDYERRVSHRRRKRRTAAELISYSVAAGGLAISGGEATASIIHKTTPINFISTATTGTFVWDVDEDGGTDFEFLFTSYRLRAVAFTNDRAIAFNADGLAKGLSPGFTVGPELPTNYDFTDGLYLMTGGNGGGGDFNGATAYMGFRFLGDTGAGGDQYGWALIRGDITGSDIRLNILEWAFDDSGAAIQVGAIPEPGTNLLALLSLGAVGLVAFRRRRDQAFKKLAENESADA